MAKKLIHMDKNNITAIGDDFTEWCSFIINEAIGLGILVLVTLFPLYYNDAYYDILSAKFYFFVRCMLILVSLVLICSLVMICIDLKNYGGEHTREFLVRLHPRNWKKNFRIADAAVLLFWLFAGIATLSSDFVHEAFWGNAGRYSGFYLISLYVILYFLVSHFWKIRNGYLELFLLSGIIMGILGIGDYFQLDLLNFRNPENIGALQSYTSTIGNINTYTAYIGMVMGFAAALFALEEKPLKLAWYYVCMVISFLAMITGRSDNTYLSIGALFILLPFILFKEKKGIERYLIIVATFFSTIYLMSLLNQLFPTHILGVDGLFLLITGFSGLPLVVLLLWAIAVGFRFYRLNPDKKLTLPVRIWGGFTILAFLVVVFLIWDANMGGHGDRYGSLGTYLVFNDNWGSHRGYAWKKAVLIYQELPLWQKLIGSGPDTFACLAEQKFYYTMLEEVGVFFDTVHNGYLQYLITNGLLGLTFYLTFLGDAFCCFFKNARKNPYVFGALTAGACYALQTTVNLELPIVTPTFWLLLGIGMAGCRK